MKVTYTPYDKIYDFEEVSFCVSVDKKTGKEYANVELKSNNWSIIAVPLDELPSKYLETKHCTWVCEDLQESLDIKLVGLDTVLTFNWECREKQVAIIPHREFVSFMATLLASKNNKKMISARFKKHQKQQAKKNFFKNLLTLPNETCKFICTHFGK